MISIILVVLIIIFLMTYNLYAYIKHLLEYQAHCEEEISKHHKVLNINKNQILLFSEILQIFANRVYHYGTEEEKDTLADIIEKYTNENPCE